MKFGSRENREQSQHPRKLLLTMVTIQQMSATPVGLCESSRGQTTLLVSVFGAFPICTVGFWKPSFACRTSEKCRKATPTNAFPGLVLSAEMADFFVGSSDIEPAIILLSVGAIGATQVCRLGRRVGGGMIIFLTSFEEFLPKSSRSMNCGHARHVKQSLLAHCSEWSCNRQPIWLHVVQHLLWISCLL